ncbi:MAG: phosphoribosyltransferase [Phycisphaerae bacterium]|nr:phosphoribosyltransferase [Phycisphaerae bacterium]
MIRAALADRAEAGRLLGERLATLPLVRPLVLAIPRGGIDVAEPIARALNADLDVVLARKLRSPDQPELALGAVAESGEMHLNDIGASVADQLGDELERERRFQMAEIQRRSRLFRAVRPPAPMAGRSVIVTDDGMATGATLVAALGAVRGADPREIIVALPAMPAARVGQIRALCGEKGRLECLIADDDFVAVGQFYRDFSPVSDERVIDVLRAFAPAP